MKPIFAKNIKVLKTKNIPIGSQIGTIRALLTSQSLEFADCKIWKEHLAAIDETDLRTKLIADLEMPSLRRLLTNECATKP